MPDPQQTPSSNVVTTITTTSPPPPAITSVSSGGGGGGTGGILSKIGQVFSSQNNKCIMSHKFVLFKSMLNIPAHINKLCHIYEKMYKEHQDKNESVMSILPCICKPCLYVIFGLRDHSIARDLNDIDCTLASSSSKRVKMGRFLHAELSYNVQIVHNPFLALNQMNNNTSIMAGVAIFPDPRLMLQLLAMELKVTVDGIKVIQLLNDTIAKEMHDKDLDSTIKEYNKLLEKFPKDLTNGYYTINDNDPKHYEKTNLRNKIHAKIVDINPNIQIHYNQLLKSQEALKMPSLDQQLPNTILNVGSGNYLGDQGQFNQHLSDARVYDILSYVLAHTKRDDVFENELKQLPPFNNTCIVSTENILVVNKDGKAYFTCKEDDPTKCMNLKRILSNPQNPPSKRKVTVAHPFNIGSKPINPSSYQQNSNIPTDSYKTKLFDIHKNEVDPYRRSLSNRGSSLNNYFHTLKDDINDDIDRNNYPVLEQATAFYPCKVLNISSNDGNSLFLHDDTIASNNRGNLYITDKSLANVIYMKNLGFVSLDTICEMGLLVLHNSEVLIDNLLRKQNGEIEFLTTDMVKNKNSTNISNRSILMTLKTPIQGASTEDAIDMSVSSTATNEEAQSNPNLDLCVHLPNVDAYAIRHTQANPSCKSHV